MNSKPLKKHLQVVSMNNSLIFLLVFILFNNTFASEIIQPLDTDKYYYAIGEGITKSQAKESALALISENITVSISSSFKLSSTLVEQGKDSLLLSESKSDISSISNEIEYTNVKVLEVEKKNSLYTILVQIDRELLFKNYHKELIDLDLELQKKFETYSKEDKLTKLSISVDIENKISEIEALLPTLHAINTQYDSTPNTTRYRSYKESIKKDFQNISFSIKTDKNSKNLALLIKEKLYEKGISYDTQSDEFTIELTTKAKKRKYKSTNEKFSKLTFALRLTTIKILDKYSKPIHTTIRKTKEASSKGFQDAINKRSKYKKIIQKIGIVPFILH